MWPRFVRFSRLTKKKKAKMATQSLFYLIISRDVTQTLSAHMQTRLCQVYERSRGGNGSEFEKGVLRGQTRAARLSELVTLLKSTFKLHLD